jgi:predicted permease
MRVITIKPFYYLDYIFYTSSITLILKELKKSYMQNFLFIANLVAPVFLIVALGIFLKKKGMINDNFVALSSRIVFSAALPALIFTEIAALDSNDVINWSVIIYSYTGTIILYLAIWLISLFIKLPRDRSVFIQGSYRGNFAIIGLAIIANMYGENNLGKASVVLAFTIPLYNLLAVIALTVPLRKEKQLNYRSTLIEIVRNPLVLAVIAALPFYYFEIPLPDIVQTTTDYMAALTLPLALLGIGGFITLDDLKRSSMLSFFSTSIKLLIVPLLGTYGAILLGFRSEDLGILFILFACPTAIASFIMAEAMGSNSRLAANILLLTTLGSALTITLGLFILKEFKLI